MTVNDEKIDKETVKNIKDMKPVERKALEILSRNPEYTNYQIGKYLKQLGYTSDIAYVSKRLLNSELLGLELGKIRERHAEFFSRRVVDKAINLHHEALKEKVDTNVACPNKDRIVKVSTCKRCENRKACDNYAAYLKESKDLKASQFKYVKLAEEVEFKTDDRKRPIQIGKVSIGSLVQMQQLNLAACQDNLDAIEAKEKQEAIDIETVNEQRKGRLVGQDKRRVHTFGID